MSDTHTDRPQEPQPPRKWQGGKIVMGKLNLDAPDDELEKQLDAFCDALGIPPDDDGDAPVEVELI